jgi:hypothetical protein
MKTRNLILIGILLFMILLTVLRESGIVGINFYKSYNSTTANNKWQFQKRIDRIGDSKVMIEKIPIVVNYKSKKHGDISFSKTIKVDITNVNLGTIWTPILKISDYKISGICKDTFVLDSTKLSNGVIDVNANFEVTGHIKIVGFCSYREAKRMIIDHAMDEIYKNAKENIK